ncbi:MAG: 4a-hydroxytetrahydrobiopterin dehydratase [Parcubacteria group bacterium]|nr:4a-hydroxytetrahydrobiopterin dehydratase [Parcubacteria group bacterium]
MTKLSQRTVPDHGPKLTSDEVRELKGQLDSAWEIKDGKLFRHYDYNNFRESKAFVDKVSELAEEANHHPDITFSFRYVDVVLYTHFRQGLTEADFVLAAKIDEL